MSEQQNAYAEVLADLEKERDGINAAIEVIRRKMGLPPDQASPAARPVNGSAGGSTAPDSNEIKPDAFFGMSVPDAIRAYLNMTKRPARGSVLTKALQDGGLQSTAANFGANVQTALHRMKDVVRVPNGWGLAEWYPGRSFDKTKREPKGEASGE